MKIVEIFQYTFVFLMVSLFATKILNNIYFDHTKIELDEEKDSLLYKIKLSFSSNFVLKPVFSYDFLLLYKDCSYCSAYYFGYEQEVPLFFNP